MKHALLLTLLLLTMDIVFGQQEPATTTSASVVEMVIPGVIQSDLPKVQSGEVWWGLCKTKESAYELVETTVTIETGNNQPKGKESPILKTDVDREFLFLVRGSPLFKKGPVNTDYKIANNTLLPGDQLDYGYYFKKGYSIFALGNVVKRGEVENYSINVVGKKKEEAVNQKILELDILSLIPDLVPKFSWVGDLDRDDIRDVFMKAHLKTGKVLMLFLSSEAQDGEIVHKVAEIQTMD